MNSNLECVGERSIHRIPYPHGCRSFGAFWCSTSIIHLREKIFSGNLPANDMLIPLLVISLFKQVRSVHRPIELIYSCFLLLPFIVPLTLLCLYNLAYKPALRCNYTRAVHAVSLACLLVLYTSCDL